MLIAGWYFISNFSLFQIKTIEVNGLNIFPKEVFLSNIKPFVLRNYVTGLLGFNNIWAWPNELPYSHDSLAKIQFKKYFWERKIIFNIEERERYGIWCFISQETCEWFDRDGIFFGDAPTTEGYLVYQIIGDKPNSGIENILKILEILDNKNITVKKINFNKKLQELEVETLEKAKIIFSTRFNPAATFISAYESIVKKIGLNSINYLDLTVENRIYYK